MLERGGRRLLVIAHQGGMTATIGDGGTTARLAIRRQGYSLIDTETCLITQSVRDNNIDVSFPTATLRLVTTHTRETRF